MALSASVGNLLRLSPAGRDFRSSFDQKGAVKQGEASSQHACVSIRCAIGVLNGRARNCVGLVNGGRLRGARERGFRGVRASDNNSSSQSGETETTSSEADVEAIEARLGLGRRSRSKQAEGSGSNPKLAAAPAKPKQAAKKWESMNLAEKAWSVYIDPEKGVLFWLNKLAYGAIFTIIGAWIVFRFIGPALGWYELDQPLLSPDRLLDGQ